MGRTLRKLVDGGLDLGGISKLYAYSVPTNPERVDVKSIVSLVIQFSAALLSGNNHLCLKFVLSVQRRNKIEIIYTEI